MEMNAHHVRQNIRDDVQMYRSSVIVVHVALVTITNILPYVCWSPPVLATVLFLHVTTSAQWHVLRRCVLSRLESGDTHSNRSVIVSWLADTIRTDYTKAANAWVLLLNYLPSVVCIVKLYRLSTRRS